MSRFPSCASTSGRAPYDLHGRIVPTSTTASGNPANYHLAVAGFMAEIDRMQLEVREHLSLHPAEHQAGG